MYLENQKVRTEHFYKIGYCREIEGYLLVITVPCGCYYDQYYSISWEEYSLWQSDVERLDEIAARCREEAEHSARFLYSDRQDENKEGQWDFSFREIVRKKYNPIFDRI